MFTALRSQKTEDGLAEQLYRECLTQARHPAFYSDYSVPDTFDGRFDMVVLHVFMVMHCIKKDDVLAQALFDAFFADMDQTLREMGIGDMGIPKHMKKMMTGFNGRVHVYENAVGDRNRMIEALKRNVYGTVQEPDKQKVGALYEYAQRSLAGLSVDEVLKGKVAFGDV